MNKCRKGNIAAGILVYLLHIECAPQQNTIRTVRLDFIIEATVKNRNSAIKRVSHKLKRQYLFGKHDVNASQDMVLFICA